MITREHLEYFFARKKSHRVSFAIDVKKNLLQKKEGLKSSYRANSKNFSEKRSVPSKALPSTSSSKKVAPNSFTEAKNNTDHDKGPFVGKKDVLQNNFTQKTEEKNLPRRNLDSNQSHGSKSIIAGKGHDQKGDAFYRQWEKKYKKLRYENLLAKESFRKFVLFVISSNDPKPFATKIFDAIKSRIMDGILVTSDNSIEDHIKKHNPSHLIVSDPNIITQEVSIPVIKIENLPGIQNSQEKKKTLWNTIKKVLKE